MAIGFGDGSLPKAEGHLAHVRVVEASVACHLLSDEVGLLVNFVLALQFHLGHNKTSIVAMKLVHLEGVAAALHQIAMLVDDARFADVHQLVGLVERNLLFKLEAREPPIGRRTFDGQETAVVADTHPDRPAVAAADISLLDVATTFSKLPVGIASNQELAFYLHVCHFTR